MHVKEIELEGHIIDSFMLPRIFDTVMDLGGDFEVVEFVIGKHKTDPSRARIRLEAESREQLDSILGELLDLGAHVPEVEPLELVPAPADQVFPPGFYATTNHPTFVRIGERWVKTDHFEMDKAIVVDVAAGTATLKPIIDIRAGDPVVVGKHGLRVEPPERPREYSAFEFMKSSVSSEKPSQALVREIASEFRRTHEAGKKVLVVCGPAVVHTAASDALATLIRDGYVDVLFGGNAVAVHDIEAQLLGTSLGIDVHSGRPTEGGHRHHLDAINAVNRAGSIEALVASGELAAGIMYEVISKPIPYVLAGSIRDDGPLPEVITSSTEAQRLMRAELRGVGLVVMLSTMLHAIAVGNMTASNVKVVCVDINPATVTKLTDRGSAQALGVVTDVGVFLPMLASALTDDQTEAS